MKLKSFFAVVLACSFVTARLWAKDYSVTRLETDRSSNEASQISIEITNGKATLIESYSPPCDSGGPCEDSIVHKYPFDFKMIEDHRPVDGSAIIELVKGYKLSITRPWNLDFYDYRLLMPHHSQNSGEASDFRKLKLSFDVIPNKQKIRK